MTDVNAAAPGVQSDVHLTSSLAAGELVELEIADAAGNSLATMSAPADADGNVTFSGVSMPPPQVVLRATANATCGIGRAELAIDVSGGSACQLSLAPAPETNAYYAPTGVLSSLSDPDAATPGYQTTVEVATLPGWTAELFETSGAGGAGNDLPADVSIGMLTVAADGVATQPVTVADGERGFYAICRGPGASELTSPSTTVLADTTPPACGLTAPAPGTTLTPRFDTDGKPGNGQWTIAVAGAITGDDTDPASLSLTADGRALTTSGTTALTASDSFAPGTASSTYAIALSVRDHAGNLCTSSSLYEVEPKGCDIQVISPLAFGQDAEPSQPGIQVDVVVQVSDACGGNRVSAVCDYGAPSTFAVRGRARLTETVCGAAPCHAVDHCRFQVTTAAGITSYVPAIFSYDSD